jgi:glycolate oxidase FAD binding subunit
VNARPLTERLRQLLGSAAIADADGDVPLVEPADEAGCALLLRTASAEGWRVAVEGAGSWCATPADADLRLGTGRLCEVGPVDAADLVATAQAGVRWSVLRDRLADHGTWLAQDVPGGDRTLGSVLATGTTGPLRSGYGAPRDHVLGLTLVTGDGRVVRVGGRVVKNVAGYDVAKLALGTFGAFGVVTSAHLRLRTVPRADLLLRCTGTRDALIEAARAVLRRGLTPAALELLSPAAAGGEAWTLAVRVVGTEAEVTADEAAVRAAVAPPCATVRGEDARAFWEDALTAVTGPPVTLRIGADPAELEAALDLVALHLDERVADWIGVNATVGTVRWSGAALADPLRRLRRAAAQREWPLTVERAPADICRAVGHFGAYREGVFRLVQSLRAAFDPAGILAAPLDPAP